ncbi:MAG: type II toxin-antitoxin system RelE/ParE family toxin [Kiritimatiellae bacterium]|jgi:toxin ParE1/3/4|nr:type II toxin-antitoxin system RelE/ParE family toxin [Kiritimatiellia bacterium]
MAEIRWTQQASSDFEGITLFIAQDSEYYASFFASKVLHAVERLIDFPASGRVVPESDNPAIREIILGNYRIVYRLNKNTTEILTICHGARLLDLDYLR